MRLVTTRSRRWRRAAGLPRVRVHFVNAREIAERNLPFVKRLQSVSVQSRDNKTVEDDRSESDMTSRCH